MRRGKRPNQLVRMNLLKNSFSQVRIKRLLERARNVVRLQKSLKLLML